MCFAKIVHCYLFLLGLLFTDLLLEETITRSRQFEELKCQSYNFLEILCFLSKIFKRSCWQNVINFLCLPSARDCQWNASAIFRLKRTKTYDDICMPSWFCYSSVARPLFPDVPTVLPSRQFIFTFNRWSKNSCNIYGVGATQLMTSTTRYFLELF